MAFSLFGKKPTPPAKPDRASSAKKPEPRRPTPATPSVEPSSDATEDLEGFSLDFTSYAPPGGDAAADSPAAPPAAPVMETPSTPSGLSLDFDSLPGNESAQKTNNPPQKAPAVAAAVAAPVAQPAPPVAKSAPAPTAPAKPPLEFAPPSAQAPATAPAAPKPPVAKPAPAVAKAATEAPVSKQGTSRKKSKSKNGTEAPLDSVLLIEMESNDQDVPVLIEEAAVLYANGQSQEALDTLDKAIEAGRLESWTLPAWLMRFDLYQQLGRKSEFEEKALLFVVKFERSAPAWVDLPNAGSPLAAARPTPSAQVPMAGALTAKSAPLFEHVRKTAERQPKIHLDFQKLESIDADGAAQCLSVLQGLRSGKKEVYVSGEDKLFAALRAKAVVADATVDKAFWLLLLDVYQQLGFQEEFEEAAVDYAVTYEVSPPSWEARPRVQPPAAPAKASLASGKRDDADESYQIQGDIAGQHDALFQELSAYAAQANPVVLDLSRVRRIDFVNAGRLLHLVEKAKQADKPVVLRAAGEMMMALFAVMGIHKIARIIPRK